MTLAVTVVQVSYPPVFGTATEPVRLVPEELAMCSASVIAVRRGHPEADRVGPGGGYLDGVLEPLPGVGPAHVVRAAGRAGVLRVGGGLEVDPVGAVAVGGAVGGGDVVGDALAAGVVVRRLDRAGHGRGRPAERLVTAGAAASRRRPELRVKVM